MLACDAPPQFKDENDGQKWITARQLEFAARKCIDIPANVTTCKACKEYLDEAMKTQVCSYTGMVLHA